MAAPERRRHRRHAHKGGQVLCYSAEAPRTENPYNFATHLVDVSLNGTCILSVGRLRPGVRMILDIHFPRHGGGLKVPARVRWSRDVEYHGKKLHMTGLQFEGPPDCTGGAMNALTGRPAPLPYESTGKKKPGRAEKRRYPRRRVEAVDVVCAPSGVLGILRRNPAQTLVNIARGGAQFVTKRPLAPGQRVRIHLRIPRYGDIFTAKGDVRWCREDRHAVRGRRFFVGVEFENVPTESRGVLRGLERWYREGS